MKHYLSISATCLGSFLGMAFVAWTLVCPMDLAAGTSVSREVKILVTKTSVVQGSEILLGEIAQIQAGPFLKEILQNMELGRAPKPGEIKQLSKKHLASLIQSQTGMPEGVEIEIPEKIYVKRGSQQIRQQALQDQVEIFLSDYFKGKDYELEQLTVKDIGPYPQGNVDLSGISSSKIDTHGNLRLVMDILIAGNREDRIRISGKVALYDRILCAKRTLAKGEQLLEKDVYFARKNLFDLRGEVVLANQKIEGKILSESVKKDAYIQLSSLAENPLIHKGEIITLVARKNALLIVTSAISKEDGYADQLIRVENIGSGKIVRGLVKERSTVEVIY